MFPQTRHDATRISRILVSVKISRWVHGREVTRSKILFFNDNNERSSPKGKEKRWLGAGTAALLSSVD
jgi:hypothetical protein